MILLMTYDSLVDIPVALPLNRYVARLYEVGDEGWLRDRS